MAWGLTGGRLFTVKSNSLRAYDPQINSRVICLYSHKWRTGYRFSRQPLRENRSAMACKSRVPVIMNALLFVALLAQTLAVDVAASARSTHTLKLVSRRHQHKLKSSLKDGQILKSRESMVDGDLLLMMQEDCNLVLYKQNLTTGAIAVVWNTSTQSNNIDLCFLKMQHDGNLVIYLTTPGHKEKTTPYWETASAGEGIPPYVLKFVPVDEASKFSGGVAIYDRDWKRTWSSFQNVELK